MTILIGLLIGFVLGYLWACFLQKCIRPYGAKCPNCEFKVASSDPKVTLMLISEHTSHRHAKAA